MTDMELAEEIEKRVAEGVLTFTFNFPRWRQIIAALRRGPERPPSGEMVMVSNAAEALRSMRPYLPYGSVRYTVAYEKVEAALQDAARWNTLLLILGSDESEPILNKLFESDAEEWTTIVDRFMLSAAEASKEAK